MTQKMFANDFDRDIPSTHVAGEIDFSHPAPADAPSNVISLYVRNAPTLDRSDGRGRFPTRRYGQQSSTITIGSVTVPFSDTVYVH